MSAEIKAGPFDAFSKHFTLNGVDYNDFNPTEVKAGAIFGNGNGPQIETNKKVVALMKNAIAAAKGDDKEEDGWLYSLTIKPILSLVDLVVSVVISFFHFVTCQMFAEKKDGADTAKPAAPANDKKEPAAIAKKEQTPAK